MTIAVAPEVLSVLDAAEIDGKTLKLRGELDRKLYVAVAKVIEYAGGKWMRAAQAHVFDADAADAIEPILLTGTVERVKQDFGQFDTPADVAAHVISTAAVRPGSRWLEPSAGVGNLVLPLQKAGARVSAVEIDARRAGLLKHNAAVLDCLFCSDFLGMLPPAVDQLFDGAAMNPPFAKQADIDHVLHAARFVKDGGRVVAIMSAGVAFRNNRKTTDFRAFLAANRARIESLPAGAFAASGTNVNTVLVSFIVTRARH